MYFTNLIDCDENQYLNSNSVFDNHSLENTERESLTWNNQFCYYVSPTLLNPLFADFSFLTHYFTPKLTFSFKNPLLIQYVFFIPNEKLQFDTGKKTFSPVMPSKTAGDQKPRNGEIP